MIAQKDMHGAVKIKNLEIWDNLKSMRNAK
jgi:hypothetical protein